MQKIYLLFIFIGIIKERILMYPMYYLFKIIL